MAVTAVSPTHPDHQLDEAKEIALKYGFGHQIIHTSEFDDENFVANPSERCYYCKLALFRQLTGLAVEKGCGIVLDGANYDDLADHRPGHCAGVELGVRSPLQEAGLTKQEIRELSKSMSLPTWDKPAYACLASRVPYGTKITPEALKRIDLAESFLTSVGFLQLRVRDHFPVARIEVRRTELELAWENRGKISRQLHQIGYPYVTLDLDGFRSGSMNEILPP